MKTVSFFCSALFLSVSVAVPDHPALTCDQLTIPPSEVHGEELKDEEFNDHTQFWNFELSHLRNQAYFQENLK